MKTITRTLDGNSEETRRIFTFLSDAYQDYKAARVLLRAELPIQGAQLASTSVEKHLKAILAFQGNQSHGHLKRAHWNALKSFDPEFYSAFENGFFELLAKAYTLRYSDSVPDNFNIVIANRELLAWLDLFSVSIQRVFSSEKDGQPHKRAIHTDLETLDEQLFAENIVLNTPSDQKNDLVRFIYAKPQVVCEVRNLLPAGLHTFQYRSAEHPKDLRLDRTGLVINSLTPLSYRLSHLNVQATRKPGA